MGRNNGEKTKKNILLQSFILFSSKPYDKVTFPDIEKATGLSRGAILYHFNAKQDIFNGVVESSLLNRSVFWNIAIKENNPLETFILDLIEDCNKTIKEMHKLGIKNINLAHYTIESQALYFYDQFDKLAKNTRSSELKIWSHVIKKAQVVNEVREDIDPDMFAVLFLDIYYGHAYAAAKDEKGCDVELLLKEFMSLRNVIATN